MSYLVATFVNIFTLLLCVALFVNYFIDSCGGKGIASEEEEEEEECREGCGGEDVYEFARECGDNESCYLHASEPD